MDPHQKYLVGRSVYLGRNVTQAILWVARLQRIVPRCVCMGYPGIPMHLAWIAHSWKQTIRKNPGTGPLHAASCPSNRGPSPVVVRVPVPPIRPVLPIPPYTAALLEGIYAVFAIALAVARFPAR